MNTTENNKLIAEFMGYKVSSDGKVYSKRDSSRELKIHKGTSGYYQLNTYNKGKSKTFLLHRIIAELFIENPQNKDEVNHIDGDKNNNDKSNLEWVTRSENIKHGIDCGLITKSMVARTGKKHWRSRSFKVYDLENNEIYNFYSTGEAAKELGFNAKSIQDALKGRLKTYKGYKWLLNSSTGTTKLTNNL